MEQQQEGQSSTWSFPLDVTTKILSKLPAKSVVRCRSVSKLWLSITTDAYFIRSFETKPSFVFLRKQGDKISAYSVPQHNPNRYESFFSCEPIDSYTVTFPQHPCLLNKTESVNGLICFQVSTNPVVWNPSMRQVLTLSKPDKSWKAILVLLGYDPVESKHKVVCLSRDSYSDECRVFTLGSAQESWRTVKTSHKHLPLICVGSYGTPARCIKGILYYVASIETRSVIMRFDVRSEKLDDLIEIPRVVSDWMILPYEGELALVEFNDNITFWVLEDGEKDEWSSHIFLPLSHYHSDEDSETFFLIDITREGELMYVPSIFPDPFEILFFDPKRGTLRRVECEGIIDDFDRQRGILVGAYFPNHTETIKSL